MLRTAVLAFFVCLALSPANAMAAASVNDVTESLVSKLYSDSDAITTPVSRDLRQVYGSTNYAPLWWQEDGWNARAHDVIAALAVSDRHGIAQNRYGLDSLRTLMGLHPSELSADLVAMGDMALTAALLAYLNDQSAGRTDPALTGWYSRTDMRGNAAFVLKQGLRAPDFAVWLDSHAPVHGGYGALVSEMQRMERLAVLPWAQLETSGLVRPGNDDDRIPEIRARLATLGDFLVIRPNHIASGAADMDSATYDAFLVAAVERFQRRHGLEDDGVLGPKTITALNVPPVMRARTIAINLERLRWLPDPAGFTGRHIVINVAGFELTAYLDGAPALNMPVIVGKARHKTPLLADQIVNVKFAPTWTVPSRIARRELLPKIQEDPTYLASNNFRVFLDQQATIEVDPAEVDWASLSSNNMPYMLRQDSGPSSALGLIRFSLTNDMSIFLHDTGSRQLFAEAERSLSHGCVRIGDPVGLADFILDGLDKAWTTDEIEVAMAANGPHFQRLAAPVPVDMVYLTAWVEADGTVHFRDDIYGYDTDLGILLELADREGPLAVMDLTNALTGPAESSTVTAALEEAQN